MFSRLSRLITNISPRQVWSALKNWLDFPYLLIILAVVVFLALSNFPNSGEWLTGWDNLHPEFDFALNLKRGLESVWLDNQGLGMVGGHGYAATIPHTLFLWFLSIFLPQNTLRAVFTFLMLFVGSLGIYFLTRYLLKSENRNTQFTSLIAALFVILNIGTVQNFYIQLEAFLVHFAFLPWLILTLWQYLENQTRKKLFNFFLVNVFIIPAAFIPPLFVVEMVVVGIILIWWLIREFSILKIKKVFNIIVLLLFLNAFWLFPFLYYTFTHSGNYLNAYNNLQSTDDFILKNQKFGNLSDVALVRGFLFEAQDVNTDGQLVNIFAPWIDHTTNQLVISIGYLFFGLGIFGAVLPIISRKLDSKPRILSIIFLLSFALLATNTPPFSWLTYTLQYLPLFYQAFRVAFTKFSILYVISLSVCIGIAMHWILSKLKLNALFILTTGFTVLSLLYYSLPALSGNFIYKPTKVEIPQAYLDLFSYMKTQDPSGRIMNLPQGWNWGWSVYKWGYTGSGFLWYGIEQPILDRSFDVWSPVSENYYWELNHALSAKDWSKLDTILEKYQVGFILFDPQIIPYPEQKSVFRVTATQEYLEANSKLSLEREFGHLQLYRVNLSHKPTDSLLAFNDLPNILPNYDWNNHDQAFLDYGIYASINTKPANVQYLFRSLFTNRKVAENPINIIPQTDGYSIQNNSLTIESGQLNSKFSERYVPAVFEVVPGQNRKLDFSLSYVLPINNVIESDNLKQTWNLTIPQTASWVIFTLNDEELFSIPFNSTSPVSKNILLINNFENNLVIRNQDNQLLDVFRLQPPDLPNLLPFSRTFFVPNSQDYRSYDSSLDPNFTDHLKHDCKKLLTDKQTVVQDENGRSLDFLSEESDLCFDIILPKSPHHTGYLLEIVSKHEIGKPLQFALINHQQGKTDFELTLPDDRNYTSSFFIIPPSQNDGVGYSLHFSNKTLAGRESKNYLRKVKLTALPYQFLSDLKIETNRVSPVQINIPDSQKIAPALYRTTLINPVESLVLSQAFDKDWQAFSLDCPIQKYDCQLKSLMPFAFGKQLSNHFLVNNWANGWLLGDVSMEQSNNVSIYLVFWPQYLEYLGLLLLPFTLLWFLPKNRKY